MQTFYPCEAVEYGDRDYCLIEDRAAHRLHRDYDLPRCVRHGRFLETRPVRAASRKEARKIVDAGYNIPERPKRVRRKPDPTSPKAISADKDRVTKLIADRKYADLLRSTREHAYVPTIRLDNYHTKALRTAAEKLRCYLHADGAEIYPAFGHYKSDK